MLGILFLGAFILAFIPLALVGAWRIAKNPFFILLMGSFFFGGFGVFLFAVRIIFILIARSKAKAQVAA